MNYLDDTIIKIVNQWRDNLSEITEQDILKFDFSKNKFREKYLARTGEFVNLTKKMEAILFKKICLGLSENYEVTDKLLDEYLEWCFDNYDFFINKYKNFSLNSCANFSSQWTKEFLNFNFNDKVTLHDLENEQVSKNPYNYFEKYGIPLASTKLYQETHASKSALAQIIKQKLQLLTNNKENLSKLKNMLRVTVENAPYSPEILFSDYKKSLSEFFELFNEPWCK